jgi:hypothetical protein
MTSAAYLIVRVVQSAPLFAWLALAVEAQTLPDQVLLKDYRPHSIFKIPETCVEKAQYPAIDVHSHNYARTEAGIDRWVRTMDEVGLEKTVILSGNWPWRGRGFKP